MLRPQALKNLPLGGRLKDGQVSGLEARRTATGISFLLYYRTLAGIQRRPKIGNYPDVALPIIRKIAKELLAQVAAGRDPMAERRETRAEATLNELATRCKQEYYHRTAWHREAMRLYKKHAAPVLGGRRLRSLRYDDVSKLHRRLSVSPATANRVLSVLSKMLCFAERWGWRDIGSNPCRLVERYPEKARRRYATPRELSKLGAVLGGYALRPADVSGVAFIYVMLFSGARPSEILTGTPDMLERVSRAGGVHGVLRLPNGKTGLRDVFLPPQAIKILDRLPENRKNLVGRRTMPRRLWKEICADIGCKDLWLRDLRRTFATIALTTGVSVGQVGELLGHASAQTTKIYAKLIEDGAYEATAAIANEVEMLLST